MSPYQRLERRARCYEQRTVRIHDGAAVINVTALEADCLWAWAVIETLRLSGCSCPVYPGRVSSFFRS